MGLRTSPIGATIGRSSSNSSKLPGMRKRSRSGSPSMLFPTSFPSSRRLSQATLHKIFIGMMATAFSLYVMFTAYLIRHHHTMDHEGKNSGMSWRPGVQDKNDEILRAHIRRLRELQQLQLTQRQDAIQSKEPYQMLTDPILKTTDKDRPVSAISFGRGSQHQIASLTLEEVDIHDMKHPKEVHKEHINATTRTTDTVTTVEQTSKVIRILTAYLEPIYLPDWDVKPLPIRNTTSDQLKVIEYPRVNSCQRLPEVWPIDDYPDADPFLP
jgi:hypothetical protein